MPDKETYDTKLTGEDEKAFQTWLTATGKAPDTSDYDLRGWWKKHGGATPTEGHMEDDFKKPNHPTFSTDSIYAKPGITQAGKWEKKDDGTWRFTAGASNLKYHSAEELKKYFEDVEPGNELVLPKTGAQKVYPNQPTTALVGPRG
jgi:hypothetical protein